MRLTLASTLACLSIVNQAHSKEGACAERQQYRMPAEPLSLALQALAKRCSFQIAFASEEVSPYRTNGLSGQLTLDEALTQLLSGTPLTYSGSAERGVVIRTSPHGKSSSTPGGERSPVSDVRERSAVDSSGRTRQGWFGALMSIAAAHLLSPQAMAQSPETQPENVQEVLVTGSRITDPNFVSAVPMTSLSERELSLGPPKLIDALTQMPELSGSTANRGVVGLASGTGGGFLSLRNFGPGRTLVLLDGMRLPISDDRGRVDISLIPDQLVSRVDVITGGASAAYGSDAVAGAVNFILDTRFEGLKSEVGFGTSTYGDGTSKKIAVSYGTPFASGMGRLIASINSFHQDGISPRNENRDWYTDGRARLASPAGVFPRQITYSSGGRYLATPAGVITTGPLAGTTFGAGGVPLPYSFGAPRDTAYQIGGDGAEFSHPSIIGKQLRLNGFFHGEFDVSDSATVFLQGSAARSRTTQSIQSLNNLTGNAATIFNDNAFLAPEMRTRMQTAGVTSFRIENIFTNSEPEWGQGTDKELRVRVGLRGHFVDEWLYNLSVQGSRTTAHAVYLHTLQWKNFYAGVDAVRDPATGQIVCRSTLQGLTPGCVPINLMGPDAFSGAAFDYAAGFQQYREVRNDEYNIGFSTQRPMFRLWATPAILAVGLEYKSLDSVQTTDPLSGVPADFTGIRGVPAARLTSPNAFDVGGFVPYSGKITAAEAFAELDVPLVDDVKFAHRLSVNMAVRHTEYDPAGPATTFKVGAVYEPVADLRFRASYSRDMRAPETFNVFRSRAPSGNATVLTPFGVLPYSGAAIGNLDLKPERANNFTIGAVYQPSWLSGFSTSIDYYHIRLHDGIAGIGSVQDIADACFARGDVYACSLITLAPDNSFIYFLVPVINHSTERTEGVDWRFTYRTNVGPGLLSARANVSYTPTLTSNLPGQVAINTAGQVGIPKWGSNVNLNYEIGRATVSLTARYLDAALINVTFTEGVETNRNRVPAYTYLDAALLYDFALWGARNQVFLNVSNLLNKDPPLILGGGGAQVVPTSLNAYDGVGRFITLGLRVRL